MTRHTRSACTDLAQALRATGRVSIELATITGGYRSAIDYDDPVHPVVYLRHDLADDVMGRELADALARIRDLDQARRRRDIVPCGELVGDETLLDAVVGDEPGSELAARVRRATIGLVNVEG